MKKLLLLIPVVFLMFSSCGMFDLQDVRDRARHFSVALSDRDPVELGSLYLPGASGMASDLLLATLSEGADLPPIELYGSRMISSSQAEVDFSVSLEGQTTILRYSLSKQDDVWYFLPNPRVRTLLSDVIYGADYEGEPEEQ